MSDIIDENVDETIDDVPEEPDEPIVVEKPGESILTSVKKLLGLPEEYEHFDLDIIMHINTVLTYLNQLGVGTETFSISDKSSKWNEFIDDKRLNMVKSYVAMKVRMLFDPPTSNVLAEAMNNNIKELEFRITIAVESGGASNAGE